MKRKADWKVLIVSLIVVYAIAFVGSLFTFGSVNSPWYQGIKPEITPPNFVFPVVWNILFFLIAISLYLAWTNSNRKEKNLVAWVFGANLTLNLIWSIIFFGLQNPLLAFFELILLWLSIILLIKTTFNINKASSYLLVPYLLWVSFAGILNALIAF